MNYFDMWKSAWNFQKRFSEVRVDNEAYWQEVQNEAETLMNTYDCKFFRDLIFAVIDEIERVAKEVKQGATNR